MPTTITGAEPTSNNTGQFLLKELRHRQNQAINYHIKGGGGRRVRSNPPLPISQNQKTLHKK